MTVILACGGNQARWQHPVHSRKHLVPIFEEPLLHRTVRQLCDRDVFEIVIISSDEILARPPATLISPVQPSLTMNIDKILSSRHVWSHTERTTLLFGDVVFSEKAMDAIINCEEPYIQWFGRAGPNSLTRHPYGEIFGLTFTIAASSLLRRAAKRLRKSLVLIRRLQSKRWQRIAPLRGNAWECYNRMHGMGWEDRTPTDDWTEINDMTDDFDYGHEYDTWIAHVLAVPQ